MNRGLRDKVALVTGGTGFIGSRLVARLSEEGCRVHLFARRRTRARAEGWHLGDARDVRTLAAAVASCRPELVFSLAAIRDAGPERGRADVESANALAASLARAGRPRIWVRTGFRHGGEVDEAFERAWEAEVRSRWNLPLVTLRLFRVYGPGQPDGELIPSLLRQVRDSSEVAVPEVGSVDLVHVDDVVNAYVLAARSRQIGGEALEIGGGELLSAGGLGLRVLEALGSRKPLLASRPVEARGGHAARLSLAKEAIGWEPRIGLAEGLRALWSSMEGGRP